MNPIITSKFEVVIPQIQVQSQEGASEKVPEINHSCVPTFVFTEKINTNKELDPLRKHMEEWLSFGKRSEEEEQAWLARQDDFGRRLSKCMASMKGENPIHLDLSENPDFNDLIAEGIREGYLNMKTMVDSGAQDVPPGEMIISYNMQYTPVGLT